MQPGMDNPFVDPSPPGGGNAPRPRDMVGCLVAFQPTGFTAAGAPGNIKGYENDAPRDRITTNVFLLEGVGGAPVFFGGTPELEGNKAKPHTHQVFAPARFRSSWISNTTIVEALREHLTSGPGGGPGMVLGRIERSQVGNQPFNVVSVKGTPDMAKGIQIWTALNMNEIMWNQPTLIGGAAMPPAGSVQYGAPQAVGYPTQPQATYGAPAAPPVDPAYAAWQAQQAAQMATPAAPVVDPAYAAWQAQQAQAAAMVQAPQIPPTPAGWDPAVWANLQPGERAQIMATIQAAQPGQMPPGVNAPSAGRW